MAFHVGRGVFPKLWGELIYLFAGSGFVFGEEERDHRQEVRPFACGFWAGENVFSCAVVGEGLCIVGTGGCEAVAFVEIIGRGEAVREGEQERSVSRVSLRLIGSCSFRHTKRLAKMWTTQGLSYRSYFVYNKT